MNKFCVSVRKKKERKKMFGGNLQHAYGQSYGAYGQAQQHQAYMAQQHQAQMAHHTSHPHARYHTPTQLRHQAQIQRGPVQYEDRQTKPSAITHLLYIDSREPVCEDAHKLGRAISAVHIIDVSRVDPSQVPECVTYLPAIVTTSGQGSCYKGSRCEQYIKHLMSTINKTQNGQEFVDTSNIDFQAFKIAPSYGQQGYEKSGMNDRHVQNHDTFGLNGVYQNWPKFSSNPVKAHQQSELFLKKLKEDMARRNIKPPKPVDDK